jgi:hypothetical protein
MKIRLLMARGASSSVLAALATIPHLMIAVAASAILLALMVFFGVALPAVWSTKPDRRKSAAAVLNQILTTLRRR